MKRAIVITLMSVLVCASAFAQNYMVVDSEKIFKSVVAYNAAQTTLDDLGEQYQKRIDDTYAEIEVLYNNYQNQRASLSESTRRVREQTIIDREKEVMAYQEQVFGPEGELMKQRVELIKPIQDRVFKAINDYAARGGYQLVLDITSNPTVLYYAPSSDKTEEIIKLVK